MARCLIMIFCQSNGDPLLKTEALKQLGYIPIKIIAADQGSKKKRDYDCSSLHGFLNTENHLVTIDSLQWCFPYISHTKIKCMFAKLACEEKRRAIDAGLDASLVICHT